MQNAAFKKFAINARYELEEIGREDLARFLSDLRQSSNNEDVIGFNVTAPFKEEIIPFLSYIDARSESVGAINTVKMGRTGRMLGFNTDYDGVVATLKKLKLADGTGKERKSKAVVIGAGGASRACILALLDNGFNHVIVLNRTIEKAARVSKHFAPRFPGSSIDSASLTEESLSKSLEECEVVINSISGSGPKQFPVRIDFSRACSDIKVFDLGYKRDSLFLASARREGLQTMDGLLMLVVQATSSFEIWTGKKAPMKTMMQSARKALKKSA